MSVDEHGKRGGDNDVTGSECLHVHSCVGTCLCFVVEWCHVLCKK